MTYAELQAWLQQHGGHAETLPTTQKEVIKTPAGDQTSDVTTYLITAKDGSHMTVKVSGPSDGSDSTTETNTYTVVGAPDVKTPPEAKPPTVPSTENNPPPEKDQGGRHFVWKANPPGQAGGVWEDVGPGQENATEAASRKEQEAKNKPQIVPTNTSEKYIVRQNADGTTSQIDNPNYAPPKTADREMGVSTKKVEQGGVTKTVAVHKWQRPDGSTYETTDDATAIADEKPVMIDGKPFIPQRDSSGAITGYNPAPLGTDLTVNANQPESLAGWQPDPSKPAFGLTDRRDQIYALTNPALKGNPNYLTPDQAKELLKSDYDLTNTMVTQQNNVVTAAGNQRSQDITQNGQVMTDQGNRRNAANSGFNQILTTVANGAKNLPKGANLSGPAFSELLGMYQSYLDQSGGAAGMERPANIPQAPAVQKYTHVELPDGTKITAPHPEAPAAGITPGPISDTAPSAWQTVNGNEPAPVEPPTISPEAAMQSGLGTQAAGIDPHNPDSVHDMLVEQFPDMDPAAREQARQDSWAMSA